MSSTSRNSYFKKQYQKGKSGIKSYNKYNENEVFNKIINETSSSKKDNQNKSNIQSEYKIYLKEENYNNKSNKNFNKFSDKNNRKFSGDSANESTSNEDNNEITKFPNNKINNKTKEKTTFKSKADDFKIKYKTELCKYYEINGCCKFGDNVRIKNI